MLLLEYKYNDELAQHIISNLAKNKEMQFNELFRTVEKMYKSTRPSKRKYAKNIKLLEEMDLINRREERTKGGLKKVFFSISEIGQICIQANYRPQDYLEVYKICYLVSVIGLYGGRERKERLGNAQPGDVGITDPITKKYGVFYYEKKDGTSIEDLSETNFTLHHLNYNLKRMNLSPNEYGKYFNLLESKGIIKPRYEISGEKRYFIDNKDYKQFIEYLWIHIFTYIEIKNELKWRFLKKLNRIEEKWQIKQFGKRDTVQRARKYNEFRKQMKMGENFDKKREEVKIDYLGFNLKIMECHKMINQKYQDNLNELKGFKKTLLSLTCPDDLLKVIEEEHRLNKIL